MIKLFDIGLTFPFGLIAVYQFATRKSKSFVLLFLYIGFVLYLNITNIGIIGFQRTIYQKKYNASGIYNFIAILLIELAICIVMMKYEIKARMESEKEIKK